MLSLKDKNYLLKGPLAGALFENFCVQETIKYIFNRGIRQNLFYLRTHNGLEVDMVIEKNRQLFPVEFKLTRTPNHAIVEPIKRFRKLFSKLQIMPGRLISLSAESMPLSRDASIQKIDDYFDWLKKL